MSTEATSPARVGLWRRLPALLRGAVVALAILLVGQLPPGIFLTVGLRFTPTTPWFLAATALWLLAFWQYLGGRGWPAGTGAGRRRDLRGGALSPRMWLWSLLAGGLGVVSAFCGALLTGLVADLPAAAFEVPFDLSPYPWWTTLAFFLNIALVAGVVEEAAFRGYMLSIVERRHGWVLGVASAAVLFYLVHLGHAYATAAFLPFFMAYSLLHGLLVYFTRSILPSVVLHALGDAVILPMQYGVLPNPLGSSVPNHVLLMVATALAAGLAMVHLARLTRPAAARSAATSGRGYSRPQGGGGGATGAVRSNSTRKRRPPGRDSS
jgi:membrane protease YdiL (CAAX protease family)